MRTYRKFTKEQRSTFAYWFNHWRAFNDLARELGVWKFRHIFHDIEKPFLRLFMDYKKVQAFHRKHNAHHLEYKGERNWLDMYLDWECSRYTKFASPRTAVEEANLKLNNGTMSYNDYCEFMRVARKFEIMSNTIHPKLGFRQRLLHRMRMKVSSLGDYCNNNPSDKYAYAFYRFLAFIFYQN